MLGREKQRDRQHTGPNMTPMVDIVMCILIFFMLGSTFVSAELFLSSKLAVADGVGPRRNEWSEPTTRVDLDLLCGADGRTMLSSHVPVLREPMLIGRPELAQDVAGRIFETSRNDAIAGKLTRLREEGLSDDALLVIRPKGQVAYSDVIRVYDACQKARFSRISFAPAR